ERVLISPKRWCSLIGAGNVQSAAEIDRRLPGQIVVPAAAMRSPQFGAVSSVTASWTSAVEEQPMPVHREICSMVVELRIQHRQVLWRLPRAIDAVALRDPKIEASGPARTIRAEIEAQAVLGECGVHVICS